MEDLTLTVNLLLRFFLYYLFGTFLINSTYQKKSAFFHFGLL